VWLEGGREKQLKKSKRQYGTEPKIVAGRDFSRNQRNLNWKGEVERGTGFGKLQATGQKEV